MADVDMPFYVCDNVNADVLHFQLCSSESACHCISVKQPLKCSYCIELILDMIISQPVYTHIYIYIYIHVPNLSYMFMASDFVNFSRSRMTKLNPS